MTMAPSQLGAFTRSDPSRETPNIQYHVQPLTLPKFGEPLDPFPAFTASVCNLNPESRGRVRITSPRAEDAPSILANYLSTPADRKVAAIFVGAAVFAFIVLRGVGSAVQAIAARAPRVRSTALRLAIGNIHRPGALTPSVVLSLGLGLTLLVTLALIDGNLRRQISGSLPALAPNFFFVDIQAAEIDAFAGLIAKEAPQGTLTKVPMLRGRVMALNGVPADKVEVPPEGAWVLCDTTRHWPSGPRARSKAATCKWVPPSGVTPHRGRM